MSVNIGSGLFFVSLWAKGLFMSSGYLTLSGPSEGVYREKMSKFIAIAMPVRTEKAAREFINRVRNDYHDARHVCWAYMLGADRQRSMLNDNGEPSGTAGKPILGQINSFGLTNIAVAVVRYFGGIKLGTSGLIGAYREVTRLALENAHIVEGFEMVQMRIDFGYMVMNDVMKVVKGLNLKVVSQDFDNACSMCIVVRRDEAESLKKRFEDIEGASATYSDTII